MNTQHPDLAEEVARFAETLPATILTDALLFVLAYAADEKPPDDLAQFAPRLRETLTSRHGSDRVGAVLRTIAAFDHVLPRMAQKNRSARGFIPALDVKMPEVANRLRARLPLEEKHLDKALSDWTALRATLLSPAGLIEYEDFIYSQARF